MFIFLDYAEEIVVAEEDGDTINFMVIMGDKYLDILSSCDPELFHDDSYSDISMVYSLLIEKEGGKIDGVYYCIHRNEDNCACRKPKPGLLEKALLEHNIPKETLEKSFFVGDSDRDVQAGHAIGCRTILVFSGKEKPGNQDGWLIKPDFMVENLPEAVEVILKCQ